MNKTLIAATSCLLAACAFAADDGALPYLPNRISETRDGLPFAKDGFGVIRNFYQSGRLSARISAIQGVFAVHYNNFKGLRGQPWTYFGAEENAVYTRIFLPQVLIDGQPYRLYFSNTTHYPFGYASECTIRNVKFSHEFVLDNNVMFRRLRVLDNPENREIRWRLQQVAGWRGKTRLATDNQAPTWMPGWQSLKGYCQEVVRGVTNRVDIEIGSATPGKLLFPMNDRPEHWHYWNPKAANHSAFGQQNQRFFLDTEKPSNEQIWYLSFEKEGDELANPNARIDKVYADFKANRRGDATFETGYRMCDSALKSALDQLDSWEVVMRDGTKTGGFRASPTYWVWGWDGMVHSETFAACGRAEEIRRMVEFSRGTADPRKGIAFSYNNPFKWNFEDPKLDRESVLDGLAAFTRGCRSRYGWQMFFVNLVNSYYQITGDEATMKKAMPWCRRIILASDASIPAGTLYPEDEGYYPDKPESVRQQPTDIAIINSAVYYQGMQAWNELTGEVGEAKLEALRKEFIRLFWDEKEGYWSDAYDTSNKCHRAFYPSYGPIAISRFAVDIAPEKVKETAAYMRKHFKMGDFISMFDINTEGYLADGNQYGAYVPVACRYYWNVMNRAGVVEALDEHDSMVARHWQALTYPEGQTADVMNPDPAVYSDDTGNKQFFGAKSFLTCSLELHTGLQVTKDGLRFHAIANGKPYRAKGLVFRGKKLDVEIDGKGDKATYVLNGKPASGALIPWSDLKSANKLVVTVRE